MNTLIKNKPIILNQEQHYKHLIALSSNSLYIVDKDFSIIECIRKGDDKHGYLCQVKDENHMLDVISLVTKLIDQNINPIIHLNLY